MTMTISLPAVITITEEGLRSLRDACRDLDSAPTAGVTEIAEEAPIAPAERYLAVEFPLTWDLVEARDDESWQWPRVPLEKYDPFNVYEGKTSRGSIRLGIGRCRRTRTWGKDRIYLITFHVTAGGNRPLCEFLETDDYETSHELIAIIRGNGRLQRSMYDPGINPPSPYRHLRTEIYRDRINYKGSWDKQAVVAHKDDIQTMLNHSLIQAETRFNLKPS
jgi:hypothetical protein